MKTTSTSIAALLLFGTAASAQQYLSKQPVIGTLNGGELMPVEQPDPTSPTGYRTRLAPVATLNAFLTQHIPSFQSLYGYLPAHAETNTDITELRNLSIPLTTKQGGTGKTAFVAGTDYLAPSGSGAGLSGITPAQVGAQPVLGFAPLNKAGDTMTGALGVSSYQPTLALDDLGTGGNRQIVGRNSGKPLWQMFLGDSSGMSGGNAGANAALCAYGDTGSFLFCPMSINRATGIATFAQGLAGDGSRLTGITSGQVGAVSRSGDTMTGALSATTSVVPATTTDIHSSVPANGLFTHAAGTWLDYCSVSGCLPGPHLLAQTAMYTTARTDASAQETGLAINLTSAKGKALYWAPSTAYSVGTQVHAGSGQDIYQVTTAGTSAASGSGPNFCPGGGTSTPDPECSAPASETNATSGTDGTITWSFVGAGINDGKAALSIGGVMNPGSGHFWTFDTSLVMNPGLGLVPAFGYELDTSNYNANYPIGGPISVAHFINGYNSYAMTAAIGVFTGGSAANKAFYEGLLFNGDNQIVNDSVADATGAKNVVHAFAGHTHINTIFDESTAAAGVKLSGIYSGAAVDTSGAAGASNNAFLASTNKYVEWAGGTLNGGITLSSAVNAFAFQYNSSNIATLGPLGMNLLAGTYQEVLTTPSSSSAPCNPGQFTDDANYHYVCVSANKWRRAALSDF